MLVHMVTAGATGEEPPPGDSDDGTFGMEEPAEPVRHRGPLIDRLGRRTPSCRRRSSRSTCTDTFVPLLAPPRRPSHEETGTPGAYPGTLARAMFVGITTNVLRCLGAGISPLGSQAAPPAGEQVHRIAVSTDYSTCLVRVGVRPVHLAPLADVEMLDGLCGLLLAGGRDIDPMHYDAGRHALLEDTDYLIDAAEIHLALAAVERGIPLLAICRGAQLLNVALGGTLHQHLPDRDGGVDHRPPVYERVLNHAAHVVPQTGLARIYGEKGIEVNSGHHQGIDRLGDGLVASAYAADDLPEAIELPGASFAVGVQWHPEAVFDLGHRELFEAFEVACRAYARGGSAHHSAR